VVRPQLGEQDLAQPRDHVHREPRLLCRRAREPRVLPPLDPASQVLPCRDLSRVALLSPQLPPDLREVEPLPEKLDHRALALDTPSLRGRAPRHRGNDTLAVLPTAWVIDPHVHLERAGLHFSTPPVRHHSHRHPFRSFQNGGGARTWNLADTRGLSEPAPGGRRAPRAGSGAGGRACERRPDRARRRRREPSASGTRGSRSPPSP
jgi:hypothetical protein